MIGPRTAGREAMGAESPPELLMSRSAPHGRSTCATSGSISASSCAAGIFLADAKTVLVEGRLARRLRELDLDFGAYYASSRRMRGAGPDAGLHLHPRDALLREPPAVRVPRISTCSRSGRACGVRRMSRRCGCGARAARPERSPIRGMASWARFPASSGWEIDILATDLSPACWRSGVRRLARWRRPGDPRAI